MNHQTATAAWLLTVVALSAADPDPRSPKDPFGRPHAPGEPVKGAFVGLSAGRTNLFFGQPFVIELFAVPVSEDGPYIHLHVGDSSNVRLEVTDGEGRPVGVREQPGGGRGGRTFSSQLFHLTPGPAHTVGVHWKPGTYRLPATVDQPVDPLAHIIFGALHEAAMLIARGDDKPAARRSVSGAIGRLFEGLRGR